MTFLLKRLAVLSSNLLSTSKLQIILLYKGYGEIVISLLDLFGGHPDSGLVALGVVSPAIYIFIVEMKNLNLNQEAVP